MKTALWAVLAAVLAGALGFYGGVTYQKAQVPSFAGRPGGLGGQNGAGGTRGANRFNSANIATGTVLAQDATSITVKTANGGSKTVFVTPQTTISKQQVLTIADIKAGDQVAAVGQAANGGVDARSIEVAAPGETLRGFGGFGGGAPNGGPPAGQ